MCSNRQWFETFDSFNVGIVLMDNDARCKFIGICTINLGCLMGL